MIRRDVRYVFGLRVIDFVLALFSFSITVFILGFRGAADALMIGLMLSIETIGTLELGVILVSRYFPGARVVLGGLRGLKRLTLESEIIPLAVIAVLAWLLTHDIRSWSSSVLSAPGPALEEQGPILLRLGNESVRDVEGRIGAVIAAFTCLQFFARLLEYFGFKQVLKNTHQSREVLKSLMLPQSLMVGLFFLISRRYFLGFIALAMLAEVVSGYFLVRRRARRSFVSAQLATQAVAVASGDRPWGLHVSDVHLTEPGMMCAEGGSGGNENLQRFVHRMHSSRPAFLFITGDLTDQGNRSEWQEARRILLPLLEGGCQVVVAPGNHDLSAAYDPRSQYVSAVYGALRVSNAYKLRRYLVEVSEICPSLALPDRTLLSDLLRQEDKMYDLHKRLDRALTKRPADAPQLLPKFIEDVRSVFPGSSRDSFAAWQRFVMDGHAYKDHELPRAFAFDDAWYEFFPLQTVDVDADTRIFVVNSVVKDLSLAGSATGYVEDRQLERLGRLLEDSPERKNVVLMHHAPIRWGDEVRPNLAWAGLARWASLAVSNASTAGLAQVLKGAEERGKEVLLLCGHRHGGTSRAPRIGHWDGGAIAEGAALVHRSDAALLVARTARGLDVGVL